MDDIRIDQQTAHRLVAEGAKLIDVRTHDENAGGALPGAINVPVQVIGEEIDKYAKPDETIVLYCRSGGRSDMAARILRSMGYSKAYNMGGIHEW